MDDFIKIGLRMLTVNDKYLLERDINERSITHKLAEHCTPLFASWDVDCEFNKNLTGPKKINIDPSDFLKRMADFLDAVSSRDSISSDYSFLREAHVELEEVQRLRDELRNPNNLIYDEELDLITFVLNETNGKKISKAIFPDIIVHKRGTKENLLVIEVKKSTNTLRAARLYDLVKLHVLVSDPEYAYKYAYFIDIPTGGIVDPLINFSIDAYRFSPRIQIVNPIVAA